MPKVHNKKSVWTPLTTNLSLEREDGLEIVASRLVPIERGEETTEDGNQEDEGELPSIVKMKLNSFIENASLKQALRIMVRDFNFLLAEAYKFSNLHILRILSSTEGSEVPKLDRNFFYRCLVAVGDGSPADGTLSEELLATRAIFDQLRPAEGRDPKINIKGKVQLLADLSIIMATMAKNHIWENLTDRLKRFLRWRYPQLRPFFRKIIDAVVERPQGSLDTILGVTNDQRLGARRQEALALAERFRVLCPIRRKKSEPHKTLPLFLHILRETEEVMDARATQRAKGRKLKAFQGRLFSLLPTKHKFTVSYIPISNMTFLGVLKAIRLEAFKGDGRDQDAKVIWGKYCNLNAVETKERRFDTRLLTDGTAVSIQMAKPTALLCSIRPREDEQWTPERIRGILSGQDGGDTAAKSRLSAYDPGFKDVFTGVTSDGEVVRFSSAKYYEDAGYNRSQRRTDRWNRETEGVVGSIPEGRTARMDRLIEHTRRYLEVVRGVILHRFERGYRSERFSRYINKRKVIEEMCDLIAPRDRFNIVGYGNWNGGKGTPISRRCAGPQQELKLALKNRANVAFLGIGERYTSCRCSTCHNKLVNMKAEETRKHRTGRREDGEEVFERTVKMTRVHKVLHCRKSSQDGVSLKTPHCGATWNRDINAAKNMMMLMMCYICGDPRPPAFCRGGKGGDQPDVGTVI